MVWQGQIRQWLLASLILVLLFLMAACGGQAAPAPNQATPQDMGEVEADTALEAAGEFTEPSQYQEAPMLAAKVAAGELPPVKERLPEEPFVVGPGVLVSEENLPNWTSGDYGGTIKSAHISPDWNSEIFVLMNEPLLSSPGVGVDEIRGNIVQDFEVNEDNTEFTFYMRKGLKWSDGEPVTTEDVRFTVEDILMNEELTPSFPARLRTGGAPDGEPMELEVIDDFTFKVRFPEAYGGFLRQLTIEGWVGYTELLRPSHYLKQFHVDYTPLEDLEAMMAEEGTVESWWNLFNLKDCQNWDMTSSLCVNYPALNPWIGVPTDVPETLAFERNPYFHKVDIEGKQLPYIDSLLSVQIGHIDMLSIRVVSGEVDYTFYGLQLSNLPVFKENEEQAGNQVTFLDQHTDPSALFLNMTYDDPVWREVVQDLRFRQALSLAINRQEIIDSVYYGFATLPLRTVGEEFSQHDPERANALLDEMGLTERDDEGFRLRPDGEPLVLFVDHSAPAQDHQPAAELVQQHLKEVGIQVQIKQIDSQLLGQRLNANELQSTVYWTHDLGWDDDHTGRMLARAGRLWYDWHTSRGESGEEPPDWVKRAFEIDRERWATVTGTDAYNQLKEEGYAWHREYLPALTLAENVNHIFVTDANMRNVPESGHSIGISFNGEQFYYEGGSAAR